MQKLISQAAAGLVALSFVLGSSAIALADPTNHGHGHSTATAHGHSTATAHGHSTATAHGHSTATTHGHSNATTHGHSNATTHGNSGTAHSCINPAGNMRGWCKTHARGATFVTGTVTAINGNIATVALSNGQVVQVNEQSLVNGGQGLTVGQQVTVRGSFNSSGVFVANSDGYNNYTGPYSGSSVSGTVISMNGNSLTIVRGLSLITINDSNAAASGAIRVGLTVGQSITAYGNWNGSVFYANSIQ